jgi:GNAT superfamily N-acetyltransferase
MVTRRAGPDDAEVIARLVNRAYEVERFFVLGDRTSADEVRRLMATSLFFVGESDEGEPVATVQVEIRGEVGAFGMLAVDPAAQGQGWGRRFIEESEAIARAAGCRRMEIRVVNVRTDLFPLYRRFGYADTGAIETYVDRPIVQPVHFVVMARTLEGAGGPTRD